MSETEEEMALLQSQLRDADLKLRCQVAKDIFGVDDPDELVGLFGQQDHFPLLIRELIETCMDARHGIGPEANLSGWDDRNDKLRKNPNPIGQLVLAYCDIQDRIYDLEWEEEPGGRPVWRMDGYPPGGAK